MVYLGYDPASARRTLGRMVSGLTLVEYSVAGTNPAILRVKGTRVEGDKKDKVVFENLKLIGRAVAVVQAPHLNVPMRFYSSNDSEGVSFSVAIGKDVKDDELYYDVYFISPS